MGAQLWVDIGGSIPIGGGFVLVPIWKVTYDFVVAWSLSYYNACEKKITHV